MIGLEGVDLLGVVLGGHGAEVAIADLKARLLVLDVRLTIDDLVADRTVTVVLPGVVSWLFVKQPAGQFEQIFGGKGVRVDFDADEVFIEVGPDIVPAGLGDPVLGDLNGDEQPEVAGRDTGEGLDALGALFEEFGELLSADRNQGIVPFLDTSIVAEHWIEVGIGIENELDHRFVGKADF